nr:hypothetical protein [Candidatus Sigynarchaeota archaeon]
MFDTSKYTPEERDGSAVKSAIDIDSLANVCRDNAPWNDTRDWHDVAGKIVAIIQEECQLHRKIMIPRLYSKIRRRAGMESQLALRIVEYLERNHFIKDNSSLLKSTILENERRNNIFQEIVKYPGTYFNLLKVKTGSGSKILEHHLTVLTEFGFVFEETMNGKRCFFPVTASKEDSWFHFFFRLDPTRKIIDVFLQNGDSNPPLLHDISKKTGMAYPLVVYHVNKLVAKNVIVFREDIDRRVYSLSKDFQSFIKRIQNLVA